VLSASATIAVAADPPRRKSGLWEITISHAQGISMPGMPNVNMNEMMKKMPKGQ
jgi:hypothetical protein